MANDSTQPGYIQPNLNVLLPLEDIALNRFLQGLVVGITNLPGKLVVQRWQPEPPNTPPLTTDWAAVGETGRSRDVNAAVVYQANQDIVYRNEILDILCSFYGPNARLNCTKLAMGLQVNQNRETMRSQGYGLVETLDSVITADLVNDQYRPRVDLPFKLRRGIALVYPVVDLLGAQATAIPDGSPAEEIIVTPPLPMFAWGDDIEFSAGWGLGNWTTSSSNKESS